ncbi:hypothetical protein [Arthrobacter sp. HLT1-20]
MTGVIEVHDLTQRHRATLAAQNFATSGNVRLLGIKPYENAKAFSRMRIGRESQIATCPNR